MKDGNRILSHTSGSREKKETTLKFSFVPEEPAARPAIDFASIDFQLVDSLGGQMEARAFQNLTAAYF